ncbi:selenocysteine-specific elongation factor [Thermosulfidibacter takaii ABI70S6]|uniref:Selenocysteine-specific elongation factor n=1 Tax=Thermosulfidibacter takaii (strain DSM 17441 / JCM 13301 / NBRC 103674 / ABI70S6) TaxID=1298851 RepID=A0A0S3QTS7_THET7|nr:selenocysteine-specific translation elongation factor [Thermosulfidibacter takaii]BAT71748.1 selenocysteine-specific elongation factor [Thermosulfidibacter takaii ABI70S6]
MKYVIVGTAGHIDHGKTSLVKAITGIDTDRLPEEKKRGITIDLGFAHYQLSSKISVSFVDVPGHEKLVKNMIAGACGIDMVLLVIAVDEGVMPQTVEHTNICQILGIKKGVVAINKIDKVDKELRELVLHDIEEFLKKTPFKNAPVVPVSAVTGEGIEELKKAIEEVALGTEKKRGLSVFRLPIDRVFTVKGFGTVVTGTVFSGRVDVKDEVEILPLGKICKVRNIQVGGRDVEFSETGYRTALNLQGISKKEVERGDVVATKGMFTPTDIVDAWVFLQKDAFVLKDLAPVRVHIATKEVIGRIKLLDREQLKPGEGCYCRIHLEEKVVAVNQEPFVIRSYSPVYTVGGGRILDAVPDRRRIRRDLLLERLKKLDGAGDKERLELFLRWSSLGLTEEEAKRKVIDPGRVEHTLSELLKEGKAFKLADYFVHNEIVDYLVKRVEDEVEGILSSEKLLRSVSFKDIAHRLRIPEDVVRELSKFSKKLVVDSKGLALKKKEGRLDPKIEAIVNRVEQLYLKAGFSPKTITEMFKEAQVPQDKARAILRYLLDNEKLVRINVDIALHKKYEEKMKREVLRFFEKSSELKVSDFKDLFGISRKYAIPYLEYLDRVGVTKRVGNVRVKR